MIDRIDDFAYITAIATHPRIWPRISADGLEAEDYKPTDHPRVYYLADPARVAGFFCWKPLNTVCFEGHIAILEGDAERFSREAIDWMFRHGAHKLVVMPPAYNWHAKRLAHKVGFVSEGVLTSSIMWRGRLHDVHIMGMGRCQMRSAT